MFQIQLAQRNIHIRVFKVALEKARLNAGGSDFYPFSSYST